MSTTAPGKEVALVKPKRIYRPRLPTEMETNTQFKNVLSKCDKIARLG